MEEGLLATAAAIDATAAAAAVLGLEEARILLKQKPELRTEEAREIVVDGGLWPLKALNIAAVDASGTKGDGNGVTSK